MIKPAGGLPGASWLDTPKHGTALWLAVPGPLPAHRPVGCLAQPPPPVASSFAPCSLLLLLPAAQFLL